MERHTGTYVDGFRGQLGTPQGYFGPNRQQPGGAMEVNLMGHHSPLALVNLGAVPKTFSQGSTPKTRLSNVSCYTNLDEDPIEAQRQIMAHCVTQNITPRDPARVVVMEDHTSPTKVHIEQPRGIHRESAHMDPGHGANRSQEQIDCIQSMSEEQGLGSTVKQGVMQSILETLQGMKLKEIRRFQQSLPENLSQARRSRRLMGSAPETHHTTGNRIEDGRIIMNSGQVYYKR